MICPTPYDSEKDGQWAGRVLVAPWPICTRHVVIPDVERKGWLLANFGQRGGAVLKGKADGDSLYSTDEIRALLADGWKIPPHSGVTVFTAEDAWGEHMSRTH